MKKEQTLQEKNSALEFEVKMLEDTNDVLKFKNKELTKQLAIQGVMPSIYVVTYNDDYGRPIFDNCFNDKTIAEEYIKDHDYLRMDNTTVIKEMDFE